MNEFDSFGVGFWSNLHYKELEDLARIADSQDEIESFWVAEITHRRSAVSLLAACSEITTRIKLGTAILGTHSRHPGILAMEAATLSELSGGRFILGIGSARVAGRMHGWKEGYLSTMRDNLRIVTSLLRGETVDYKGSVFQINGATLDPKPERVPVYVGCYPTSMMTLDIAAEYADGVILLWVNADLIAKAVDRIDNRAKNLGRDPAKIDKAAYVILSVDRDREKARSASMPLVEFYANRIMDFWKSSSLIPDVPESADTGWLTDKLTISGTPSYCIEKLSELKQGGLKTPIFYQVLGPDPKKALKTIAKEIIPSL